MAFKAKRPKLIVSFVSARESNLKLLFNLYESIKVILDHFLWQRQMT